MPSLTKKQKEFIVMHHAMFYSNPEIRDKLEEELDVSVSVTHIDHYNADKSYRTKRIGKQWIQLFNSVRKSYLEEIEKVPISKKAFRLNALQRIFEIYMQENKHKSAQSALEQAAQEVGGVYEHRELAKVADNTQTTVNTYIQNIYNRLPGNSEKNGMLNGNHSGQKKIEGDIE